MSNEYTRKIGQNKGRPRLWLEGAILTECGFSHGERYNVTPYDGYLTIEKAHGGKRKIAGKAERPIIDMLGKVLEQAFTDDMPASVTIIKLDNGIIEVKREG